MSEDPQLQPCPRTSSEPYFYNLGGTSTIQGMVWNEWRFIQIFSFEVIWVSSQIGQLKEIPAGKSGKLPSSPSIANDQLGQYNLYGDRSSAAFPCHLWAFLGVLLLFPQAVLSAQHKSYFFRVVMWYCYLEWSLLGMEFTWFLKLSKFILRNKVASWCCDGCYRGDDQVFPYFSLWWKLNS